jgi:hypothetical protein
MAKCAALKGDGSPCQAQALKHGRYCFTHDPASGAPRAQAHKLGGQRRRVDHARDAPHTPGQVRTMADVLEILDYALAESLVLENSIARGRLLVALCGSYIETIKTGELETRLVALETRITDAHKADESGTAT